jgi:general secretion pathway protein G
MNRRSNPRSGGFTLIEVLLVLVILVVLFSLAVVSYGPIRKKMQKDSAKTQVGLLNTAVRTYEASVGDLPPNLDGLRAQPADVPQGKWAGPYLDRAIPMDPWNKPYQFKAPGDHNTDSFDVWTIAPDGEQIGNWTQQGAAN